MVDISTVNWGFNNLKKKHTVTRGIPESPSYLANVQNGTYLQPFGKMCWFEVKLSPETPIFHGKKQLFPAQFPSNQFFKQDPSSKRFSQPTSTPNGVHLPKLPHFSCFFKHMGLSGPPWKSHEVVFFKKMYSFYVVGLCTV